MYPPWLTTKFTTCLTDSSIIQNKHQARDIISEKQQQIKMILTLPPPNP